MGTLCGQLLFGWLADVVGRKRMCESSGTSHSKQTTNTYSDGFELIIIIVGTFAQALAGSGYAVNIIGVLIVWRFVVRLRSRTRTQHILIHYADGHRYRW